MVQLVDAQQEAVLLERGQVQVGGGGDRLVGGDVAGQPAAGVGRVVGGAHGVAMAEERPPGRVDERLLGLAAQRVARHDPADPLDDRPRASRRDGAEQAGGGDHRQGGLAAAGRDRGQDVGQGAGSTGGDGAAEPVDLLLVPPQAHGPAPRGVSGLGAVLRGPAAAVSA